MPGRESAAPRMSICATTATAKQQVQTHPKEFTAALHAALLPKRQMGVAKDDHVRACEDSVHVQSLNIPTKPCRPVLDAAWVPGAYRPTQ